MRAGGKTLRAAALGAIVLLGATACGGEETSESVRVRSVDAAATPTVRAANPKAALLDAAAKATAQSASIEMTVGGVKLVTGSIDPVRGSSQLVMDLGSLVTSMAGTRAGQVPFSNLAMTVVSDGTTSYLQMGELGAILGVPADRWIKVDNPAAVGQLIGSSDPTKVLADLRKVTGDITEKGREQVRGVGTTRYGATLRYGELLADLSAAQRRQVTDIGRQAGISLDDLVVPVDVWIDGEGRLRRLTMDLTSMLASLPTATGAPGGRELGGAFSSMTLEMFDYGTPVNVTIPPADQVVDARTIPGLRAVLGG